MAQHLGGRTTSRLSPNYFPTRMQRMNFYTTINDITVVMRNYET